MQRIRELHLLIMGKNLQKMLLKVLIKQLKGGSAQLGDVLATYDSEIVPNFNTAIARTKEMSKNTTQILNDADKKLPDVKKLLEDSSKGLVDGKRKLQILKLKCQRLRKRLKN